MEAPVVPKVGRHDGPEGKGRPDGLPRYGERLRIGSGQSSQDVVSLRLRYRRVGLGSVRCEPEPEREPDEASARLCAARYR